MKKSLKILIATAISISMLLTAAQAFTDMTGSWSAPYVTELSNLGVIDGYPDGTFKPTTQVTRSEMAKIILTATQ